jgi:DNA-binding transcriptional ArsR family regulator
MVEHCSPLDSIFSSLADPTRRDILRRVSRHELSINEVAAPYDLTLAAISKHLMVLEHAKLISKRRAGKQHFIAISPPAFKQASQFLRHYQEVWEERLDRLQDLLAKK